MVGQIICAFCAVEVDLDVLGCGVRVGEEVGVHLDHRHRKAADRDVILAGRSLTLLDEP